APPSNVFHPGKVVSNNPTLENRGWLPAGNADEWITVDLGGPCVVRSVQVTWDHWQGPPAAYRLDTSLDGRSWTKARDGAGPLAGGVTARFVRLYVSQGGARGGIGLSKWEVFGQPAVLDR
ncbi:MAG: discoidin domain-containing protein, partial [Acidobacteria bacterium]|nr:discoidin domain-containing protein [Acidobacteriota bacterium]